MKPSSASSKIPLVLGKVASLTSIRDIDIFEFSFMKTLAEMLNVNDISLYKFDDANKPCRLIRYTYNGEVSDGKKKIDETREIHIENIPIPEYIKHAQKWIESTKKVYSFHKDNEYITVFPVVGINHTMGYLTVNLQHELSNSENLVISSLLSISENFNVLLEDNQKDKLTGLLNRKTFDDSLDKIQEIIAFTPADSPDYTRDEQRNLGDKDKYWLSIIDIDSFKNINDNFGHIYGDEVLLMLSQIMKNTFRPSDLLFRFGGEEFVVIAKVSSQDEASLMFERFREAIESFTFPQIGQVTISLGATLISNGQHLASDIVGRADKALYHAKQNGKNKLFIYENLIAQGILEEKNNNGAIDLF